MIDHDDGKQFAQDHGLFCDSQYSEILNSNVKGTNNFK